MTHSTYHCPLCGSDNVEELLMGWFKANDREKVPAELDRPEAYPDRYYCGGCGEHPDHLEKREGTPTPTWSPPFFGISHYQPQGADRWATVEDRGKVVILLCWYKGCGLTPHPYTFQTLDAAKAAGEAWTRYGQRPVVPSNP
jgi:hypothetical protein